MLFDSKIPTLPSGLNAAGTVPEWLRFQESVGFVQGSFESYATGYFTGGDFFSFKQRMRIEVPQP